MVHASQTTDRTPAQKQLCAAVADWQLSWAIAQGPFHLRKLILESPNNPETAQTQQTSPTTHIRWVFQFAWATPRYSLDRV